MKKKKAKTSKIKSPKTLKVTLTKELGDKDTVVYTNYGRFKLSKNGKVTLDIEGKKLKANYA